MRVSERLEKALALLGTAETVADVGADHGQLSLEILRRDIAKKVIVTDISAPSLKKAENLLFESGFGERAEFRIGDGLSVLKDGEADVLAILGMGGSEIVKILRDGVKGAERLVLSPQHDSAAVREFVVSAGFKIIYDGTVRSKNKFYDLIKCERGADELTYEELNFGRSNVAVCGRDFTEYLGIIIGKHREGRFRCGDTEDNIRFMRAAEELYEKGRAGGNA